MTDVFKIPHSGSYPSDFFRWRSICEFYDKPGPGYQVEPFVIQILLGFVCRLYPEATEESLMKYENKCFTIVAETSTSEEYVFVYRHDSRWVIGAVDVHDYELTRSLSSMTTLPYALHEELPRC
jgi:hypothetical protein